MNETTDQTPATDVLTSMAEASIPQGANSIATFCAGFAMGIHLMLSAPEGMQAWYQAYSREAGDTDEEGNHDGCANEFLTNFALFQRLAPLFGGGL